MSNPVLLNIYKEDLKVPRYTSYPTAPHFHSGITASIYEKWLKEITPQTDISLYVHIPFCKKLCWFCGCNTRVVNDYNIIGRYLELLKKEIDLVSKYIKSPNIKHIHFGGGSPTIIKPDDFIYIMQYIRNKFLVLQNAEIAIEIDPRTASEAKIAAYARSGVNRASIGIQDFNDVVQKSINRIQPFPIVYETIQMLHNYGINNINTDLIYGLPHQDTEALLRTINLTLTLNPERIALFSYAHVPWMKKHQQLIDTTAIPDIAMRLEMYHKARQVFEDNGYVAIGLDHFVLKDGDLHKAQQKGQLQRNFQGYTTDTASTLIGLGISSIGSFPQGYIQNVTSIIEYSKMLGEEKLPVSKGVQLGEEDVTRRAIISSLMCYLEVDLKQFRGNFSREIKMLQPFVEQGAVVINDSIIKITRNGRSAMRIVASVFDTYLNATEGRHSSAV